MSPRLNRLMLTTHVTVSVGWFGAVTVFVVLAIAGISSADLLLARASYLAMELIGWFVVVPFCLASLVTGIIQAVGTKWGLFKHYWIIVKLILTLFATVALLLHMKPIGELSLAASATGDFKTVLPGLKLQLVANSGAAFLLLLAIITISVFKPWGKTKKATCGNVVSVETRSNDNKSLKVYLIIAVALLFVFVVVKHLLGGMGRH